MTCIFPSLKGMRNRRMLARVPSAFFFCVLVYAALGNRQRLLCGQVHLALIEKGLPPRCTSQMQACFLCPCNAHHAASCREPCWFYVTYDQTILAELHIQHDSCETCFTFSSLLLCLRGHEDWNTTLFRLKGLAFALSIWSPAPSQPRKMSFNWRNKKKKNQISRWSIVT